jgi:hypothetical protein
MQKLYRFVLACSLVSVGSAFSATSKDTPKTLVSKARSLHLARPARVSTLQVQIKIGYGGPELNGSSIMEGGYCTMTLSILKDGGVEQPDASYFNIEWAHDGGYDYGYPYYYQVPTVGPYGDDTHQMNVMVTDTRDNSVGTYGAEYQVIGSERGVGYNCNL